MHVQTVQFLTPPQSDMAFHMAVLWTPVSSPPDKPSILCHSRHHLLAAPQFRPSRNAPLSLTSNCNCNRTNSPCSILPFPRRGISSVAFSIPIQPAMELVAGLAMPASTSKLMICRCNVVTPVRGFQLRRWQVGKQQLRRGVVVMQAKEPTTPGEESDLDEKILPYCDISKKGKKTLGEMEQDFLEALQSFYFDSTPIMSNEEFDNLKEELTWEGSSVVILSSDEQRFLEASLSYAVGKPILSDQEFDQLKLKLKQKGSKVAIAGPRCSLRSRKVVSDATVDYLKMTLLNLPAALIALGLVFFLDDITGFEITYLLELPEPYSFFFTWFIVLPVTFLIAQSLTNLVIKDALILNGPCPNCGVPSNSFFGSILTVPSEGQANYVKCEACGSSMKFDKESRLITLDDKPPEEKKPKKPAAKPASEKVSTSA